MRSQIGFRSITLRLASAVIAVLLAAGAAWSQTPWTKYVDNPVLEAGDPGEWDQGGVACGAATFDGTTYHLWYAGIRTQWPDIDIGYATSPDGVTWTKHPGNPVLERGAAGAWDSGSVFPSAVVWDGATYHMWYVSASGSVTQTGYATSPDGVTWTKHPDNPVLRAGDPGSWDETKADIHAVLAEGGIYRAWYNGRAAGASWEQIGYATSPDGVTWTKHPDPVLSPAGTGWDGYTVQNATTVFDGTYQMWYTGGGNKAQIGHASSSDGIHWVRQPADEPVLPSGVAGAWDNGGVDLSQVLLVGETAHMWYTGWVGSLQSIAIGYATAPLPLPTDCPELVGRWPYGPAFAAEVSGGYLYSSSGSMLRIAELSDPSAPHVVGEIALPDAGIGIRVSGDYAYVADHSGGLRVVDLSVPSAPVEVGFLDTPGVFWDVAVSGDYVYVAAWEDGLRVIDVSTPSAPVEVALLDTPGGAWGVVVSGGFAYVADDAGGLRVIDVSTPSAPVEVWVVDTPGFARGVAVSGDHAYVADYYSLRVIDLSAPSAPVEVGFVDTPVIAWAVAASGGFAYVADWDGALRVIDVSAPSAPVEVGLIDTPGLSYWVAVAGGYAYVADSSGGLRVIDVGVPSAPVEVDVLDTPGWSQDVAVAGAYAYVADDGGTIDVGGGLYVLDLSTPSAPVEAGFVHTPDIAYGVAVSGSHAYVAAESAGLRVIDVSSPTDPVEVGSIDTPGAARGVAVSRGFAYVADWNAGLRVVDVSSPFAPVEVGFLDTPGLAVGVAVSHGYAFVADTSSLRVIDVSTPSAPVEVSFINAPGPEQDVAVSGRYAYLANGIMGLRIIDVSEPSAPVEVGVFDPPGSLQASGVAVSGAYAYVAEYYADETGGSLRVIDVGTPSAPLEVGYSEIPYGDSVAVSGGRVVVGGLFAGVYVYVDCGGGPSLDGRECFISAAAVAAGAQGAFFQTDVEINNTGTEEAQLHFEWLPRGQDNSVPAESEPVAVAPGQSLRYENVLTELFGLEPDSLGALRMVASTEDVIGMSRTYNIPAGETAGTFGQGLPAIRATEMIQGAEPQRIIFLSENDDSRANVGCVNGTAEDVTINIGVFDDEGTFLETRTMDLGPWSNNQINRVFEDYAPVNGYVDVWSDSDDALYYCYGSMLDNLTSDPTTILPQVPSDDISFIPAAALAAGLEGAFFQTDVDLNNVGSTDLTYRLAWLPRGEDNSGAVHSDTFSLAPGAGVRYANVLDEVFGLEPDQVGALAVEASGTELLAMSRTYNLPSTKVAGTFGQELPGIPADRMIASGVEKRIIFMNENDDARANVGCQNGSEQTVRVYIELFNSAGESLETKTMDLAPWSNNQITRVFRNYSPVEAGYVDVWTNAPGATIYCYGSVLDNVTSDPTTVLPQ